MDNIDFVTVIKKENIYYFINMGKSWRCWGSQNESYSLQEIKDFNKLKKIYITYEILLEFLKKFSKNYEPYEKVVEKIFNNECDKLFGNFENYEFETIIY